MSGLSDAARALGMPEPKPRRLAVVPDLPATPVETDSGLSLRNMIGQDSVRNQVLMLVESAIARGEMPEHMLFAGPPGVGKTAISKCVARALGAHYQETMGSSVRTVKDVGKLLAKVGPGGVLFIDEAHQLTDKAQELLGLLMMPPYAATLPPASQLVGAEDTRLSLAPGWTLICATTRPGKLTGPLLARFGMVGNFTRYPDDELAEMAEREAKRLSLTLSDGADMAIAVRSHGTPREAERLVKRVRDYVSVVAGPDAPATAELVGAAIEFNEIDDVGLTELDLRVLNKLASRGGGPIGLKPLATSLGEDPATLEAIVEPKLIHLGLMEHSQRGRKLTFEAFDHLGMKRPAYIGWGA